MELSKDDVEFIRDILSYYEDKGPIGYGWQSDRLKEVNKRLDELLTPN